ncbi:MAG: ABC transporter ATP-binding protein [Firmicutes bacterium]|jgi:peptide/nickel transport system ATP-binding protein|nr:ABC transporter ATP-binding protein [Bacillota bacterium]
MNTKLLEVENLKTYFFLDEGTVKAIDGVSLSIGRKETLGVVGESGCGKSVTALSILRVLAAKGKIVEGTIKLYGDEYSPQGYIDLAQLDPNGPDIRKIRGKEIAMIFQEPMTSFSPVYTVGNQIMEAILLHQDVNHTQARDLAIDMLRKVGIPSPEERIDEYPYQLSGGMRQRAMIAMALCCNPKLLIADEPTTALDVTIQAQILDLMRQLQDELGMSIMLITHNLGVVAEMSQHVAVMYLGRIVESAPVDELFHNPLHPYTKALLKSIPKVGKKTKKRLESIKGTVPDAYNIPPGCSFHRRCPQYRKELCNTVVPNLVEIAPRHEVACLLYDEVRRHG